MRRFGWVVEPFTPKLALWVRRPRSLYRDFPMTPAAHALLDGLIDYAGLFPPAALDLEGAVDHYARHRTSREAWMLQRFITPAALLARDAGLDGHVEQHGGMPWHFSVLGLSRDDGESWLDAARRTLEVAHAFDARHDGATACDRFEIKLPADLASDHGALVSVLTDLEAAYRERGDAAPRAALEVALDDRNVLEVAADATVEVNRRADRPAFALKFRCGGVTPDLVPSVEQVAGAVSTAIQAGAPFKATAGLHHPLPNHDAAVGARMHGFLGVFGGAALARLHGLRADDLAEIVDDDDPASWSIEDGLRWRSLRATAAEVADARQQSALSFGSCSFEEPLEDLEAMGWLGKVNE